jgi:hypothetical protein
MGRICSRILVPIGAFPEAVEVHDARPADPWSTVDKP